MSLGALPFVLDMIESARKQGIDITTEAYPYTAASTFLGSTIFDDGWQETAGHFLRRHPVGKDRRATHIAKLSRSIASRTVVVIMHLMKPEWIQRAMASPLVLVASDGMQYAPGRASAQRGDVHPRVGPLCSRTKGTAADGCFGEDDRASCAALGSDRAGDEE